MNSKFPVLSTVSILLRLAGWGIILGGVALALILVFIVDREDSGVLAALAGLAGLVSGLIVVAFGEIIGVLFAIEVNTRNANIAGSEVLSGDAAPGMKRTESGAVSSETTIPSCSECGATYDPAEYNATASVWFCSVCKAQLQNLEKSRAG